MIHEQLRESINNKVNKFIVSWCAGNVAHLTDADEDDGEKLRNELLYLFDTYADTKLAKVVEEIEKNHIQGKYFASLVREQMSKK